MNYIYHNQETNEPEVLTENDLLAFFNESDDKKNGSDFEGYIYDNIRMGLLYPCDMEFLADGTVFEE